jgi:hypothetical protein
MIWSLTIMVPGIECTLEVITPSSLPPEELLDSHHNQDMSSPPFVSGAPNWEIVKDISPVRTPRWIKEQIGNVPWRPPFFSRIGIGVFSSSSCNLGF